MAKTYDTPLRREASVAAFDFASGVLAVAAPAALTRGSFRHLALDVTTATVDMTLQVGTLADPDAYGSFTVPAMAVGKHFIDVKGYDVGHGAVEGDIVLTAQAGASGIADIIATTEWFI